jgi:hypothetical protein
MWTLVYNFESLLNKLILVAWNLVLKTKPTKLFQSCFLFFFVEFLNIFCRPISFQVQSSKRSSVSVSTSAAGGESPAVDEIRKKFSEEVKKKEEFQKELSLQVLITIHVRVRVGPGVDPFNPLPLKNVCLPW